MDTNTHIPNRINVTDEGNCCGCLACMAVCPTNAISKTENERGFIVPTIDDSKCINCGFCLRTCDFKKEHKEQSNNKRAYALIFSDKKVLRKSTSGGAFTALSDVVLRGSGFVVGSVMEDDFTVHHVITNDSGCRNRMRGSKYVQSDIHEIFHPIKDLLLRGEKVMFSGTPCQCAALRSFLGQEYDNLIVVDLLCHGVPNNNLFKEHIYYLEKYYGKKIVEYSFRDKKYGWDSYTNVVRLSNNREKAKWINQVFYSFFVNSVSLRPSCFNCVYRSYHRYSDITIGDFWGYNRIAEKKNKKGVSLVIVHSDKGQSLIEDSAQFAKIHEIEVDKIKKNIQIKPTSTKLNKDAFWKKYQDAGYSGLVHKYFDNSVVKQMRFVVKKIIKKVCLF